MSLLLGRRRSELSCPHEGVPHQVSAINALSTSALPREHMIQYILTVMAKTDTIFISEPARGKGFNSMKKSLSLIDHNVCLVMTSLRTYWSQSPSRGEGKAEAEATVLLIQIFYLPLPFSAISQAKDSCLGYQ